MTGAIRQAIAMLKEGRVDDAILFLERTVDPKFGSFGTCVLAYAHRRPQPINDVDA